MKNQRGVTLTGLLMVSVIIGAVALLVIKVLPDVIEFYQVAKVCKAIVNDPGMSQASISEVRASFDRRADIDMIKVIAGKDLEISKDSGQLIITYDYTRRIPLFANVSLLIDFTGSTSPSRK